MATALEKHYTINELAEQLGMSFGKVRLLVMHEPGVLKFNLPQRKPMARTRTMYRIPESVIQRILRRSANV